MSAAATSLFEQKDLRSERLVYKRDKEHSQKWANGQRPGAGARITWNSQHIGPSEEQWSKIRPMKQSANSDHKSHANKVPKPHGHYDQTRLLHKADALTDANDHTSSTLSKSLLELLPQHANNTQSPIQTAIRSSAADAEILYSFDNKGPSPGAAGRKVDLGGLVELAEQKWVAEQTEKIIKGEYEVLDNEGETTVLAASKKKRGSPKQRATTLKNEPSNTKSLEFDEDEGFELV